MTSTIPTLAALAVGAAAGALALALGAPLWGILLAGAGGVFVTKKAIDVAAA